MKINRSDKKRVSPLSQNTGAQNIRAQNIRALALCAALCLAMSLAAHVAAFARNKTDVLETTGGTNAGGQAAAPGPGSGALPGNSMGASPGPLPEAAPETVAASIPGPVPETVPGPTAGLTGGSTAGSTGGSAPEQAQAAADMAGKERAGTGPVYTEDQAFRGALRRDVSLLIAKSKARYRAMIDAARYLAGRQDVQVVASKVVATQPLDPVGLAYAVYDVKMLPAELSGFSPELMVRASLTLVPRYSAAGPATAQDSVEYSLVTALKNLEVVNLYSSSVKQENEILKQIIPLADQVMREPPKSKAQELELSVRFANLADKLIAIDKFRSILPKLEDGIWKDPEKVVETMQQTLEYDPQNPLVLDALGESLLILGKAQEAVEYLTSAIRLRPDNARTYHARGAAYLSLHLPALAIDDFSAALRLRPNTAAYFEARGAARLSQGEFTGMCEDFYSACALGECKNYQWALERGYCRQTGGENQERSSALQASPPSSPPAAPSAPAPSSSSPAPSAPVPPSSSSQSSHVR